MTDLTAFDDFAENISLEVQVMTIGGFLPARQFWAKDIAVTFFFDDDGNYTHVGRSFLNGEQ